MKKLIAMLVAVMMATLPVLGLAADFTTDVLEAIAGGKAVVADMSMELNENFVRNLMTSEDDAETVAAIIDLFNSLGFTGYVQKDQAGLSVTMSGNDLVSLSVLSKLTQEGAIYVASNLLGSPAVRLSIEDMAAMQKYNTFDNIDSLVEKNYITEEQAQQMKDSYQTPAVPDMSSVDWTAFTFDNTAMFIGGMMSKVENEVAEDGSVKIRVVFDGDDEVAFVKAIVADVKTNASLTGAMDAYLASVEANVTFEEVLDQLVKEVEREKDKVLVVCEVAATDNGTKMTATWTMGRDGCDGVIALDMSVANNRGHFELSYTAANSAKVAAMIDMDDVGARPFNFAMKVTGTDNAGKEVLAMDVTAEMQDEENYSLKVEANGQNIAGNKVYFVETVNETPTLQHVEVTMTVSGEIEEVVTEVADTTKDHSSDDVWYDYMTATMTQTVNGVSQTMKSTADTKTVFGAAPEMERVVKVFMEGSDTEAYSAKLHVYATDAMPAVSTADAVSAAKMDQASYTTWTESLSGTASMQLTLALMQNLPASVMKLMMKR